MAIDNLLQSLPSSDQIRARLAELGRESDVLRAMLRVAEKADRKHRLDLERHNNQAQVPADGRREVVPT